MVKNLKQKSTMSFASWQFADKKILIKELKDIDKELNIIPRLSAISKVIQYVSSEKVTEKGYYLLQLNFAERILKINSFITNQIELATQVQSTIEYLNNPNKDVVLVSANSFEELQTAYPNYFF